MSFCFKIIDKKDINIIIPLMQKLTNNTNSDDVLKTRFAEMVKENYECAGVYLGEKLIGICGMWFQTRHYAGKSMEVDHVYIEAEYQGKGLGKLFFKWIYKYAKSKGCNISELNTYVQNYPSHKFYYNEGYEIYGYHFYKTL
ncbi:GNAT family N-acetyltransferase [Lacinutrix sp. 5H-3-7-4]|uniref:GNAT family N-acetyltransferase n=1 Tax=Lacinutrix sp. (strain 5H-3-7-4) TaxID=983544 RepID=UPI00020A3708|nr:GNAT family N-acetyltransferase [Lacinutrix sp. 5H-3-7-4]AEH00344.1 GCN5-related N-acetyltransferase [Lacinutrix sp. 5H-3-7-4]